MLSFFYLNEPVYAYKRYAYKKKNMYFIKETYENMGYRVKFVSTPIIF